MNDVLTVKLERVSRYPGELALPPQETYELSTDMENMIIVSEREGGMVLVREWFKSKGFMIDQIHNLDLDQLKPQTVIVCDRVTVNDEDLYGKLAGKLEELPKEKKDNRDNSNKIIVLTHNINLLAGTGAFSTIFSRLPTCHAITAFKNNLPSGNKRQLIEYLGEQYTLTKRFFTEHADCLTNNAKVIEMLKGYEKRIEVNPPNFVSHWLAQLDLLLVDPAARRELVNYLEGEIKSADHQLTQTEIKLYLAGWLKLDASNKLKIRSLVHQSIAKSHLAGAK